MDRFGAVCVVDVDLLDHQVLHDRCPHIACVVVHGQLYSEGGIWKSKNVTHNEQLLRNYKKFLSVGPVARTYQ